MSEAVHLVPVTCDELPLSGHPLATRQWAEIKQWNGWDAHPFLIPSLMCSILLLSRKVGPFRIGYVPYADLPHADELLLDQAARAMTVSCGYTFTFIRFDLAYSLRCETGSLPASSVYRRRFSIQPRSTVLIELGDDIDTARSHYAKRARRALRKAREADADTFLWGGDEQQFDSWYRLYLSTAQRDGFLPRSRAYLAHVLRQDGSRLFIALQSGRMVGGIITLESENQLLYLFGATEKGLTFPAGYLLQDAAISYACDSGLSTYDLHGIGFDEHDHLSSLNLFKTSFGGEVVTREGSMDVSLSPFLYLIYRTAENFRLRRARSHGPHA